MLKRITVFMLFSSLLALSMYGCGKNEPGNPQLSSPSSEQDFAKTHKNVDFNKEDKEKMHGLGMETEGGGHGMGVHGKKEKPDPSKVIATVNNEKILRKDLDKILDRFKKHVNPAALISMEQQITEQLVTQSVLRQFVVEQKLTTPEEVVDKEIAKMRDNIKKNPTTKDKTLEQFLEFQGSNIEELKTAIRMSAAIETYVSKGVDDKKQEEYFMKNISNFNGETVTASHILVDTKGMKAQEELDKARAKIESVKKNSTKGQTLLSVQRNILTARRGKLAGISVRFPDMELW